MKALGRGHVSTSDLVEAAEDTNDSASATESAKGLRRGIGATNISNNNVKTLGRGHVGTFEVVEAANNANESEKALRWGVEAAKGQMGVKRGRGRPRKAQQRGLEPVEPTSNDEDDHTMATTATKDQMGVKRGRGRPRKAQQQGLEPVEPTSDDEDEDIVVAPAPRGQRGGGGCTVSAAARARRHAGGGGRGRGRPVAEKPGKKPLNVEERLQISGMPVIPPPRKRMSRPPAIHTAASIPLTARSTPPVPPTPKPTPPIPPTPKPTGSSNLTEPVVPISTRIRRSEHQADILEESEGSDVEIIGQLSGDDAGIMKMSNVKLDESEEPSSSMEEDEPRLDKGKARAFQQDDSNSLEEYVEQPTYGSSKTTGGILRGGRDIFNLADNQQSRTSTITPACHVRVFVSAADPSTILATARPSYGLNLKEVWDQFGPLLGYLGKQIPIIMHMFFVFKDDKLTLSLLVSDFSGETEPVAQSSVYANAVLFRSGSHGSGTQSVVSDGISSAPSTRATSDPYSISDTAKQELYELCELSQHFPHLPFTGKSHGVRLGIQRFDALRTAVGIWEAKKAKGTWPSSHSWVTAASISAIWFKRAAWFGWQSIYSNLTQNITADAAFADMLAWLAEAEGCKSDTEVWGSLANAKKNYSTKTLETWIKNKKQEVAKAQKAMNKTMGSKTKTSGK
ncbi:hypothetical protein H1R20_g13843, partial [Candolleomyces eurysporus]